jgi:hypothetical protein
MQRQFSDLGYEVSALAGLHQARCQCIRGGLTSQLDQENMEQGLNCLKFNRRGHSRAI